MTETIEDLRDALAKLQSARKGAEFGTGMMIQSVEDDLETLIKRTERIVEEADE